MQKGRPESRPLALHGSTSLRRAGDLKERPEEVCLPVRTGYRLPLALALANAHTDRGVRASAQGGLPGRTSEQVWRSLSSQKSKSAL